VKAAGIPKEKHRTVVVSTGTVLTLNVEVINI